MEEVVRSGGVPLQRVLHYEIGLVSFVLSPIFDNPDVKLDMMASLLFYPLYPFLCRCLNCFSFLFFFFISYF